MQNSILESPHLATFKPFFMSKISIAVFSLAFCAMPSVAMAAEPSSGTLIQLSALGFFVVIGSMKVAGSVFRRGGKR